LEFQKLVIVDAAFGCDELQCVLCFFFASIGGYARRPGVIFYEEGATISEEREAKEGFEV